MFNVGPAEIAVVFGVALLIFGPKKLPELGRSLGQGIGNFKKSLTDAQSEMKAALKDAEVDANAAASAEEKTANKS